MSKAYRLPDGTEVVWRVPFAGVGKFQVQETGAETYNHGEEHWTTIRRFESLQAAEEWNAANPGDWVKRRIFVEA